MGGQREPMTSEGQTEDNVPGPARDDLPAFLPEAAQSVPDAGPTNDPTGTFLTDLAVMALQDTHLLL